MRSKWYELLVFSVISSLVMVGCGGGGGGGSSSNAGGNNNGGSTSSGGGATLPTPTSVAQVVVSPANPTIAAGNSIVITAVGQDSTGAAIAVPTNNWSWTSSNGAVALLTSVGDHATITGVAAGTATITAKEGNSKVVGSVTLTVTAAGSSSGGNGGTTGTTVYSNDFQNGAGPEWSNTQTDVTPGTQKHASTRFLGQFGPGTVSLTLGSLPAHSALTIEMDLFVIRSMDGNASVAGVGPDVWDLSLQGGAALLHTTFSNITAPLALGNFPQGYFQSYPDTYPGGSHPYQTGAAETNTLGYYWSGLPDDAIYHLKYTVPHTAATVQFNFTSSQTEPINNESWGLKNVKVTANP